MLKVGPAVRVIIHLNGDVSLPPELFALLTDGMIEVQETNVVRIAEKSIAHRSQGEQKK